MPDETIDAPVDTAVAAAPAAPSGEVHVGDLSGFAALGLANPGDSAPPAPAPAPAPAAPPRAPAQPKTKGGFPTTPRKAQLEALKDHKMREALLNTSNEAFSQFYDIALKLQNGEYVPKTDHERLLAERAEAAKSEVATARYHDHERGYMLTPEYEQLASGIDNTSSRLAFWEEQLGNFTAGQPFRTISQNEKGEWVISQQQYSPKDNPTAAGILQSQIARAHTELQGLQGRLAELPKSHKEVYSKHRGTIDELNKTLFGGATNPAFKAQAEKYLKAFPPALQGDNQIVLIANLRAAGDLLIGEVERLQTELTKAQNGAKAASKGAPAPISSASSSTPVDMSEDDIIAAFDKRLAR